jgi:hypothetical protein
MYNGDVMQFDLNRTVEILRQTPFTLKRMLEDLSPEWTRSSEDPENWGPYDILGHLIHGEETDWIERAEIILKQGEDRTFQTFDRLAQFTDSRGKSLSDLLTEFSHLRNTNVEKLLRYELTPAQLELKGMHPALGEVALSQLLATWAVHDLNHIRQIVTWMAKQYDQEVGPWKQYLSILQ